MSIVSELLQKLASRDYGSDKTRPSNESTFVRSKMRVHKHTPK